jgi:hypothetical protein
MRRHMIAKRRLARHGIVRPPSTRPILRQVLKDRLRERIAAMIKEKIHW